MQTRIFHILSLVMKGNLALQTGSPLKFDEQTLGLQHNGIQFQHLFDSGRGWEADLFASNSHEWIKKLRTIGCKELRAYRLPSNHPELADWTTAGFVAGGGRWMIRALCSYGQDYWEPGWTFQECDTPASGYWRVQYGRIIRADQGLPPIAPSVSEAVSEFRGALGQARAFASGNDLPYMQTFDAALAILNKRCASSSLVFRSGVLKSDALALGSACDAAWVFGAMGSWNDLGFSAEVQPDFERVSERLYLAITSGLVAATNSAARQKWWQRWRS